jgi:hypothetical protein
MLKSRTAISFAMLCFIGILFYSHEGRLTRGALLTSNKQAVSGIGGIGQHDEEINSTNWQRHPRIVEIRSIVDSINVAAKNGALKTSTRKFEYCEPGEDTLRRLSVDSKNVGRRYEKQNGSDDSAVTSTHYYDTNGRIRFVFISGGAVNESKLEHRIYFDESGKRLWEEHKYVKGPGYTVPNTWPDELLQLANPAKAFAEPSKCPERKRGSRKRVS